MPSAIAVSTKPSSLMNPIQQEERPIRQILYLGELLETCHFQAFWVSWAHLLPVNYLHFQSSSVAVT